MKCGPGSEVLFHLEPRSYLQCLRLFVLCHETLSTSHTVQTDNTFRYLDNYMWSDNKVRELATVCLPWQQWTKALVCFDDDISAFHSCVVFVVVVVDLWQSLSEWHLLLPACVLVCRRENVGA